MAPSKNNPLYNNNDPREEDVYQLGKEMMGRSRNRLGQTRKGGTEDVRFRQFFGIGVSTVLLAWRKLKEGGLVPNGSYFYHFLWTLMFIKIYSKEKQLCAFAGGVDPKTFRKYVWQFIRAISELHYTVICFENRFKGDIGNDCLMSIDGTDFQIRWINKDFWSYKYRTCGLRYEVGLNILTGDICWTNGPYAPGLFNDLMIFEDILEQWLGDGERVEADDGYVGKAPLKIKCPAMVGSDPAKRAMKTRVRARHETCNKRFKQWGILKQVYRHDIPDHQDAFRAVAVLTQLAYENGERLFDVEYND